MGMLSRLLPRRDARSLENPSVPLNTPYLSSLGAGFAATGVDVNYLSALSFAPWKRGICLIANSIAKLDLFVYRRLGPRAKETDPAHPAYSLLFHRPNELMTAFTWRQTMAGHVVTAGNAYSLIWRDGAARPTELLPLAPDYTWPVFEVRQDGSRRLWYAMAISPTTGRYEMSFARAEDVLHFKNFGYGGLLGLSVLALAREALGLGLAAAQFGAVYFRNSGAVGLALEFPLTMPPQAIDNVVASWERKHTSLTNQHRIAILREGVKLNQYRVSAADAQLLETRKFSLLEIAQFLDLPPHYLGAETAGTYSNKEMESQDFLDTCLDPHLVNFAGEARAKLLSEDEKETDSHTIDFDRRQLIRANLDSRTKFWTAGVQYGAFPPNDWRAEEGYNPRPGGDACYPPPNMTKTGADGSVTSTYPDAGGGASKPAVQAPAPAGGLPDRLIPIEEVRQEHAYDCGAACVRAVCRHFGVGLQPDSEDAYITALGTTEADGTSVARILEFLVSRGLTATAAANMTLDDLAGHWKAGRPVLVPFQDYGTPAEIEAEDSGHYSVVIGGPVLGFLFIMDPSASNAEAGGRPPAPPDTDQAPGIVPLPAEEFLARWWRDRDATTRYLRFGIAVGKTGYTAADAAGGADVLDPDDGPPAPDPKPAGPEPVPAIAAGRGRPRPRQRRDDAGDTEPLRSVEQALDILERLPDADADGRVALTMPVNESPGYELDAQRLKELWDAGQVQQNLRLPLATLIATRPLVKRDRVAEFVRDPGAPSNGADMEGLDLACAWIVRYQEELFVFDGHHRLMASQLRGVTETTVYLVEM